MRPEGRELLGKNPTRGTWRDNLPHNAHTSGTASGQLPPGANRATADGGVIRRCLHRATRPAYAKVIKIWHAANFTMVGHPRQWTQLTALKGAARCATSVASAPPQRALTEKSKLAGIIPEYNAWDPQAHR